MQDVICCVADHVIPGSGYFVPLLIELTTLVSEVNSNKEMCEDLLNDLYYMHEQLQAMENRGNMEYSRALTMYKELINEFMYFLVGHVQCNFIMRVGRHGKVKNKILEFHRKAENIYKLLHLEHIAETANRHARVEQQHKTEMAMLVQILNDRKTEVVSNLDQGSATILTLSDLQYEVYHNRRAYTKQEIDVMEQTLKTAIQAANVQVPATPIWYISRSDIRFDVDPFAESGLQSFHYGITRADTKVVVKFVFADQGDAQAQNQFMNETDNWFRLRDSHLLQLFGACHVGYPLFFVSERAENGNFSDYLRNNQHRLWRVFYDVAQGLQYLHKHDIIHGNLKCSNLLVKGDGSAVISDFGYCFMRSDAKLSAKPHVVSSHWKAPECLKENSRRESDVYSLGMCVYEAITGGLPFGTGDEAMILTKIRSGQFPPRTSVISDMAWELITDMCRFQWRMRIELTNVIERLKQLAKMEDITERWKSQRVRSVGFTLLGKNNLSPQPITASSPSCVMTPVKLTPSWFLSLDRFNYDDSLVDAGVFRSIHNGIMDGSKPVVVKFVYFDEGDTASKEKFFHEANIWFDLKHPNILQLVGANHLGVSPCFVTERAEYGSLRNYLPRNRQRFWRVFLDIAKGLEYLHQHNIVHNNLKCSNLLVKSDGTAVISDFWHSGSASTFADLCADKQWERYPCNWKAPECLLDMDEEGMPWFQSDVYSLGMCIYEAMAMQIPHHDVDNPNMLRNCILAGDPLPRTATITDAAWKLISNMCMWEWRARLKLSEVIQILRGLTEQEIQAKCGYCFLYTCNGCGPTKFMVCTTHEMPLVSQHP